MSDKENTLKDTMCAVGCYNANGEPEILFYAIRCTPEQYSLGLHYETAKFLAENDGYSAKIGWDSDDPAGVLINGQVAPSMENMVLFDISTT